MKFVTSITATVVLLLLLAWLPFFGPLVAGLVGGWIGGSLFAGIGILLTISFGTAAVVAGGSSLVTGMPWVGAALGTASLLLIITHLGPLVIGIVVGVIFRMAFARRRRVS